MLRKLLIVAFVLAVALTVALPAFSTPNATPTEAGTTLAVRPYVIGDMHYDPTCPVPTPTGCGGG
jgi:hypothetical protein